MQNLYQHIHNQQLQKLKRGATAISWTSSCELCAKLSNSASPWQVQYQYIHVWWLLANYRSEWERFHSSLIIISLRLHCIMFEFLQLWEYNNEKRNVFSSQRNSKINYQDLNEIMIWQECILSHSLLQLVESHQTYMHLYWNNEGVALLRSLTQSSHDDVQ